MIRRIVLENYMAHVRTVIEPAEGLTAIIGPNNCGKSAIIHALEMICYNSDAADFAIRHGTRKATVTVETEDEDGVRHTLVWWRSRGSTGYSIDGREISGVGRGVPEDLHQHLRMPKIEPSAGGPPFFVHFGLQKSPIFLLDQASSRAAHFFASSSDADKLVEMQKRHAQKTAGAKRDKEKLDVNLNDLDQKLQILSPLPDIGGRLTTLEDDHLTLIALGETLESLEQSIDELDRAAERERISQVRLQALSTLQRPPALQDIEPISQSVRLMSANVLAVERNAAVTGALDGLAAPPLPLDVPAMRRLTNGMEKAAADGRRWTEISLALGGLASVPQFADPAPLARTLEQLQKLTSQAERYHQTCDRLGPLAAPPTPVDMTALRLQIESLAAAARTLAQLDSRRITLTALTEAPAIAVSEPLAEMIRRIEAAAELEHAWRAKADGAEQGLDTLRADIELWVEDHPNCTTCGQPVSAELILSGGHGHE